MCFTRTASRLQPPGLLELEIGHKNSVFFTNQAFKACDFGGCFFRISGVWPSFGAVYFNDEESGIQREDRRTG